VDDPTDVKVNRTKEETMDRIDEALRKFFTAAAPPPGLAARAIGRLGEPSPTLESLAERFDIEASERGVARIGLRPAGQVGALVGGDHARRARAELREFLSGRRAFFSVPVDLSRVPAFQGKVLAATRRINFGEVVSYATLAARVGHPRAARAVGNALGANPVPVIVPCHRIIRGDGTWGHYAFGGQVKTDLLRLEQSTPALVGCATTRIVCRHGCAHEQQIAEGRRVVFASVADAVRVGYRRCRACLGGR
jgi:methylated-DNA-[protein]-cysteine S-methyltransferase